MRSNLFSQMLDAVCAPKMKDGDIVMPREVIRELKENRPVKPERLSGGTGCYASTGWALTQTRRSLMNAPSMSDLQTPLSI